MTENENTRSYRQGIQHERDRIIALLEADLYEAEHYVSIGYTSYEQKVEYLEKLIALIKGENE